MFKALRERLSRTSKEAEEALKPEAASEIVGESGRRVSEGALDKVLADLELGLLQSDVALSVAEELQAAVREELSGKRIDRQVSLEEGIELALKAAVLRILSEHQFSMQPTIDGASKPFIMMFVGINGSGKTTAIAKLAHRFQQAGYSCVLAAADTFRAGAIEQLQLHADRLGAKLIRHKPGSDPAAVAYDAVEHARARGKDLVLIDTAGRMQTNVNLMDEMKKIKRVAKPNLVLFIGDALNGNDAVEQARQFDAAVGIDGIILTKIDADAKGGAALSIAHTVGKPILYVSTGQEYEDFHRFKPEWMVERLFETEAS